MPYVYGIGENAVIIANTETGDIKRLSAVYEKAPVGEKEFLLNSDIILESFPSLNLSPYKERYLRAVLSAEGGPKYKLYQMDGEIWLASLSGDFLWSIYRLKKTDGTGLSDLERALELQESMPSPALSPASAENRMTLKDIYALARKGEDLLPRDFERFYGKLIGSDFTIMRYDVEGGCVVLLHYGTPQSRPAYVRLSKQGYDPFDENRTVDIRAGADEVAKYLNPLNSLMDIAIEDTYGGTGTRELIYEFDGYQYYLNTTRGDQVFVIFERNERMPLKQALEERRICIEDAVAHGLYNVFMVPVDNPMGGEFTVLHHRHTFKVDGEAFYPSKSFMYVVWDHAFATYFDIEELAEVFEWQGKDGEAEKLRRINGTSNLPVIAGRTYISETGLSEAGIAVNIGWELSSHTPVQFTTGE